MSSTRYADDDSPLREDRYFSHPAYVEQRPICGMAVAAKVTLLNNDAHRKLILFLQGATVVEHGLKKPVNDIMERFGDQIGTPTMHAAGIRPNKKFDAQTASKILKEINPEEYHRNKQTISNRQQAAIVRRLQRRSDPSLWLTDDVADEECSDDPLPGEPEPERSCDKLLEKCRYLARATLKDFILRLCIDPDVRFPTDSREPWLDFPFFKSTLSVLLDYQKWYAEQVQARIVMTTIAERVFKALDLALRLRKTIAIVEGDAGLGKSTDAEAWALMHLGESRPVRLKGIMDKTSFCRAHAVAQGTAAGHGYSSNDIRARVEEFYAQTGIMPVIDQAHFMWPEGQRITKRPVLLDWIYTALYDNGVPSALVATKAFTERCQQVCKQTLWNYKQMRRRIDPWEVLPDAPTESDLERVALLHLPDANTRCLDLIVGYALFTKGYFDAVVDLISQARLLAQDAGRSRVIYGDLEQAQTRHQVTESNKAKAFAPLEQPKRRRGKAAAASPQPACEEAAEDASMNRFSVLNGTAA